MAGQPTRGNPNIWDGGLESDLSSIPMSKRISLLAAVGLLAVAIINPVSAAPTGGLPDVVDVKTPILFPIHEPQGGRLNTAPLGNGPLTNHGGMVMSNAVTVSPIYWGKSWTSPTWVGDKQTGMKAFYEGYSGSGYANTSTEYTDSSGKGVTKVTNWGTSYSDSSRASSSTSAVANEVLAKVGFTKLDENGYYPVYTDLPRRAAGYCAWHSAATVKQNGVSKTFKFAFFFDLTGDGGCTPGNLPAGWTQPTHAIGNVSAHELAEMLTDPQLNAWYDAAGYENGDKCAWDFSLGNTTFTNNANAWRLQAEWSNRANSGAGGCIISS